MAFDTHIRAVEAGIGRRVTLGDVARVANVSEATVSKVLNGRKGVGEPTRERVEHVIRDLGYVSVSERQGTLRQIGEATIEIVLDPDDVDNPYFSTFLGGALRQSAELNVALLVRPVTSINADAETRWAQALAKSGRVGVIEVTSRYSPRRESALRAVGLPMVLVDPIDRPRPSTPSIGATNWAGAYEATQHLLGLGHQRIAYVGGPPEARCDIVRAHGWAAAMADAGLPVDVDAVPRRAFSFDHGLEAGTRLLAGPDRPTAIFAGSDISAKGVLEAARRAGLLVPEDLSVVGFDDTYLAQSSTPQLTTVHQPIADIGRNAVATVLRLAAGDALATRRIELATHLIIRDSTAAPAATAHDKGPS
jgi:LacI family transcriptional regulator